MSIYRFHQFENELEYYTGAGCLVCGSNVGPCIDLGVVDSIEGAIALCEDHARECGVHVGMVDPRELEQRELDVAAKAEEVADAIEQVESLRHQVVLTERNIQRLIEGERAKAKPATPKAAKS